MGSCHVQMSVVREAIESASRWVNILSCRIKTCSCLKLEIKSRFCRKLCSRFSNLMQLVELTASLDIFFSPTRESCS